MELLQHSIFSIPSHLALLSLLCCIVIINYCSSESTVVVDSPFGKIRGASKIDENTGQSYLSFKGIPYAKPPVGDLRFAKPQPHPKLDDVRDGTEDKKIICPHLDVMTFGETEFTEECLVLNVYAQNINPSNPLKVLVYLHGGAFKGGYSTFYDPKSIVVRQKIIVVTFNYRIGIFGFLSTENEASPGNYGLWDQTLAIRWVKDNIRAFGGDPDDITIGGESAGGISTGYQMISPQAKGLFTRAYPHSGIATSTFSLSTHAQKDTLILAKTVGCWNSSVDEMISTPESYTVVDCLRRVPVSAFASFSQLSLTYSQFTPRVDDDFISDTPANLLQDDKYLESIGFFDRSYLIAFNNNEASALHAHLQVLKMVVTMNPQASEEDRKNALNEFMFQIRNNSVKARLGEPLSSNKRVINEINQFYDSRYTNEEAFIEMTTDVNFLLPSLDFLRAMSRRESCNSYFLFFNHFPQFMKGPVKGSAHGVDTLFLFDMEIGVLENLIHAGMDGHMSDEDLELKSLFVSLVGEFVRMGKPELALKTIVPSGWPRYDAVNSYYLDFGVSPSIRSFLEKDKQHLWFDTVPNLMGAAHEQHHSEL